MQIISVRLEHHVRTSILSRSFEQKGSRSWRYLHGVCVLRLSEKTKHGNSPHVRIGDRRHQEGQRDELQLDHGRPHGGRVPDEHLVVPVHLVTDETQNVDPEPWVSTHDASWATNNNNNQQQRVSTRERDTFHSRHTAVPPRLTSSKIQNEKPCVVCPLQRAIQPTRTNSSNIHTITTTNNNRGKNNLKQVLAPEAAEG